MNWFDNYSNRLDDHTGAECVCVLFTANGSTLIGALLYYTSYAIALFSFFF